MRCYKKFILIFTLFIIILFWRMTLGEWDIPFNRAVYFLLFAQPNEINLPEYIIIREIRLPRFLSSAGAGGILAAAGAILQGLLSNSMAEPYTLGIASGAAFGASVGILSGEFFALTGAFFGAISALIFVFLISFNGGREKIILSGIIVNAFLSAGVTFIKSIAGEKLNGIILWLMGSFAGSNLNTALNIWIGALIILISGLIFSSSLDAMSLGNDYAKILGINEELTRAILLITSSMSVALVVSSFGIISFVGLVIPHLARILIGASHKNLIIYSFMLGSCLLSFADGIAQIFGELPAGVLTALTGGPFFCWLLMKK